MLPSSIGTEATPEPTISDAVAGVVFAATFVDVTAPAGSVLAYVPAAALETATDTEHDPLAGTTPPLSATVFPPATAVTAPPHVVAPPGTAVLTSPEG